MGLIIFITMYNDKWVLYVICPTCNLFATQVTDQPAVYALNEFSAAIVSANNIMSHMTLSLEIRHQKHILKLQQLNSICSRIF